MADSWLTLSIYLGKPMATGEYRNVVGLYPNTRFRLIERVVTTQDNIIADSGEAGVET